MFDDLSLPSLAKKAAESVVGYLVPLLLAGVLAGLGALLLVLKRWFLTKRYQTPGWVFLMVAVGAIILTLALVAFNGLLVPRGRDAAEAPKQPASPSVGQPPAVAPAPKLAQSRSPVPSHAPETIVQAPSTRKEQPSPGEAPKEGRGPGQSPAQPDDAAAREALRQLYLKFDTPAYMAAYGVLWRMTTPLVESKDDPVRHALGKVLRDCVLQQANMVRSDFGTAVDADPGSVRELSVDRLQELLTEYYRHYRLLRDWIGRTGRLVRFQFWDDREFQRLVERDKQFRARLEELSVQRRFSRWGNDFRGSGGVGEDLDVLVAK